MNFLFPQLEDSNPTKLKWVQTAFQNRGVCSEEARDIPDRIYQYRKDADYSLYQIENSCVYLSNPSKFADKYDCIMTDDEIRGHLIDQLSILNRKIIESNFNIFFKKIKKMQDESRVSCTTDSPNYEWMWEEYANNKKGFCIEFDYKKLLCEKFCGKHAIIFPVIYTNMKSNIVKMIIPQIKKDKLSFKFTSDLINALVLTKKKEYEKENEWRIFDRTTNIKRDANKKIGNGMKLTWSHNQNGEVCYYKYIPITRVIIGKNTTSEIRKKIVKIAERRGYPVVYSE